MRTEEDIRLALRSRADQAPTDISLTDLPRRRRAARQRRVAVASACGVVALVAGVLATRASTRHPSPVATTPPRPVAVSTLPMPTGPTLSTFTLGELSGYTVSSRTVERGFQFVVLASGGRDVAAVYESGAGQYQKQYSKMAGYDLTKGKPVSIGGRPGYQVRSSGINDTPQNMPQSSIRAPLTTAALARCGVKSKNGSFSYDDRQAACLNRLGYAFGPLPDLLAPRSTVAWEYAPDSWALVQWMDASAASDAAALQVARAVQLEETTPLLTTFSVDHLPAKYDRRWEAAQGHETFSVSFGTAADNTDPGMEIPGDGITITSSTTAPKATMNINGRAVAAQPVVLNGRASAYYYSTMDELNIAVDGGTVSVASTLLGAPGSTKISLADLIAVAQSMRFATSLTDTSTWFDATQALPH